MSTIGDFWKEEREKSKAEKKLRKQNKKKKLTKEQKAYKIFGVFLCLFLIFGSFFYTCRGSGDVGDITLSKILGIDEELKELLSQEIDTNILLPNGRISASDYEQMIEIFADGGLDIFTEGYIDADKLTSENMTHDIVLQDQVCGAFINRYFRFISEEYITILDVKFYNVDDQFRCRSVATFRIDTLFSDDTLPVIYVTNDSEIDMLDGSMSSIASTGRINLLNEADNEKVISTLNRNIIYNFNKCINAAIVDAINSMATLLQIDSILEDDCIGFKYKSI